jgi:glycosyltransferase involved in cell wall biosynthesis
MADQSQTIETSDPSALPASPLVSVYTLAYKHEKFIAQAIDGIITQQCNFPIELIIGEDCSPDRTREIALDYQRRYPHLIRVLTSEKNVGAYANARRCQLATRGKYIAICEGDDYWHHPRKLQMQVDLMEANPSMVVSHTDFDRLTKFRRRHACHKRYPSRWLAKDDAFIALLHEWSVMTVTCMFRRDVLTSFIGSIYDNPAWPFGDRNKLLFASLNGTFGYIDKSTATFRKRGGSAMNSGPQTNLSLATAALECIELFISKHPPDKHTGQEALAIANQIVYYAAFRAGQAEQMDQSFTSLSAIGVPIHYLSHRLRHFAIQTGLFIPIRNVGRAMIDRYLSAM